MKNVKNLGQASPLWPHLLTSAPFFSIAMLDNPSFPSLLQQVKLQVLILAGPTSLPQILTVSSLSSFEIHLRQQFHREAILDHHVQHLPGPVKSLCHIKVLCFLCCTYYSLKFLLIYLSLSTLPLLLNLHKKRDLIRHIYHCSSQNNAWRKAGSG